MLNSVFFALSDETRRDILRRLAQSPMSVGALAKHYPISLNAVSKHIKVLEAAELVTRSVHGKVHEISLVIATIKTAQSWLFEMEQFWQCGLDELETVLASAKEEQQ